MVDGGAHGTGDAGVGGSGHSPNALPGVRDVPRLVAELAESQPDRAALSQGDIVVTYAQFHEQLVAFDASMGGALDAESLVPVVVSTVLPDLVAAGGDALGRAIDDLRADLAEALAGAGGASVQSPDTLPALFRAGVEQFPDAVALEFGDETLTYREFADRARALARRLIALGVGPEVRVGLSIRRSFELLIGMYAIVEAGGAYVPIDPDQPADRVGYILSIATPPLVLTTAADRSAGLDAAVAEHPSITVLEIDAATDAAAVDVEPITDAERLGPLLPEHTAYVIFTSGSTGRPKGVAVPHRAIVANLRWRQNRYRFTPDDVIIQKTPFTFDVSVWEFFWTLQVGARLFIAPPDAHRDPEVLATLMARRSVTVAHFVPSMLAVFVAEPAAAAIDSLRMVIASGEALPAHTAARLREISSAALHNLYGPTEAAVDVTHHEVTAADATSVPIGKAVPETGLLVLDDRLRAVPPGAPGELYLTGIQLARGYVARPDLSSDRFVADPTSRAGGRMYRTGDLVRRRPDGTLDYLGRTDFQVKLRGLRIELGEIESALTAVPGIEQAVVIAHSSERGDHLVAYIVTDPDVAFERRSVIAALGKRLPDYMVPAIYMPLEEIPLNANGKADRGALPEPDFSAAVREYRAPSTDTERAIAGVFAEILGAPRIGLDDDFFELGGNSLSATRVISRVNAGFGVRLNVRGFFDAPTVAELAAATDAAVASGGPGVAPLAPRERPERIPLSLAQQRMWFLNRFDVTSAVNNIPVVVRLSGLLDRRAMEAAIGDVIERHESLRTIFPEHEGVGHQVIVPASHAVPQLSPETVSEAEVVDRVRDVVRRGFDVALETPFRVALFEVGPLEHILVLVAYHISADGFSMAPLARDVMTAYAARTAGHAPGWEPLAVQYADYTLWQREVLGAPDDADSVLSRQLHYWRDELADLPDQIDLPADRARPAIATNRGAAVSFSVDAVRHGRLLAMARENNASLFMVVHAALATVLARLSAGDDIVVGTPIAGRGEEALDDLVGMFVNTLVLRLRVDAGESFDTLLDRARTVDLGAFGNADVPFEYLVEDLDPPRSQARHPLFQVMLSFQNQQMPALELDGLSVEVVPLEEDQSRVDIQVTLIEQTTETGEPAGLAATIAYATDLFEAGTMRGFANRLVRVLGAIVDDPTVVIGDIDLLDTAESIAVRADADGGDHAVPDRSVVELFFERAAATPDAIALSYEGTAVTFAELAGRVTALAARLRDAGVGRESAVALVIRRSPEWVTAMLATMAAGGAYVPIDPDHPADRIAYVLEAAAPTVVLVTADTAAIVPATATILDIAATPEAAADPSAIPVEMIPVEILPDQAAYLLFTSGSTGKPKGVVISHRSLVNQIAWIADRFAVNADDVVLFKTPATFDVSLWELFSALCFGARLVVASPDGHRDPAYLQQVIADEAVTLTSFVPSMLAAFSAGVDPAAITSLRAVLVAGEAFDAETLRALSAVSDATVHNLYGPTEFTVHATEFEVDGPVERAVPIGRAVWNSRAYVLDARLHPVATGVPGELYLSGTQVARAYHGRGDLSAERFVADPFRAGERMYRTGDLVVRRGDAGVLTYLGRTDFQVKLRGQRIELGEIEAALLAQPSISRAVVTLVSGDLGGRLVGYVVPAANATVDETAVLSAVRAVVPSYMVPAQLVVLEAFPLNASGKLDRKALPIPTFEVRDFRAPSGPIEEIVAGAFAQVLGVPRIGADDNFFDLGGNSLTATQLVSRLSAALGTTVPVRLVFDSSTVRELAAAVDAAPSQERPALGAYPRPERIPLSAAQQRMWFLNRFDSSSVAYNMAVALRLSGDLDVEVLRAAIGDVVERHEVLRTVYPEHEGVGYQHILPAATVPIELTSVDVPADRIEALALEAFETSFDVRTEVPLRVRLLRPDGSPTEHVLIMVVHHIAADGFSMGPLTRDVMIAYESRRRGEAPQWPPLVAQYADYSLWQREVLGDEADQQSPAGRQIDYWRSTLANLPEQLNLRTDRPRPAVAGNHGGAVPFEIDEQIHAGLERLARDRGATVFMVTHAVWAALLARLSASTDIAIGTPILGRPDAALEDVIGMFVNTLVLRTAVDPQMSFDDLIAQTRDVDLTAFAHADVPFERLVEVLNPVRSTARHPLFQVALSFQNLPQTRFELSGLTVSPIVADAEISQFDLHLMLTDTHAADGAASGITGRLTYASELFDRSTAEAIAGYYRTVLAALVTEGGSARAVGDIDILTAADRERLVDRVNATDHRWPADAPTTLGEVLRRRFDDSADRPAITAGSRTIDYAQLRAAIEPIAAGLRDRGVGPEVPVAIAIPRSVDLVVAMYAITLAGGAYLPIDPAQPVERLERILATAGATIVLTVEGVRLLDLGDREVLTLEAAATPGAALAEVTVEPTNAAYVLFTSGSTGTPKGVTLPHRAVVNQLLWMSDYFDLTADDVVLLHTAATFDLSVWQFWSAVFCGGRLVIADAEASGDPEALATLLRDESVTTLSLVPSALQALQATDTQPYGPALRRILSIGEALPADTAARHLVDGTGELFNLYGPTEAAVSVTRIPITEAPTGPFASIGSPEFNCRVYVLDSRLRPVPEGVVGELYIAGGQLARGYATAPGLSSERFVASPFVAGERMYRSGDLVTWRRGADGELDFVGRADFQVKLRGFRIELGDIEAALRAAPGVVDAAATVFAGDLGDRLVGYVVPRPGGALDLEAIDASLRAAIPSYMVPESMMILDALPQNSNGKVDRKALPAPVHREREFRAPQTHVEQVVADVFAELLGRDRVGLDDDFFELGGNSLIATRLVSRLGNELHTTVAVRTVFEAPDVEHLARLLEPTVGSGSRPVLRPVRRPQRIPLSPAQTRMWFLSRLDTESGINNIPVVLRLTGELDAAALDAAVADVVARHESLRTVYPELDGVGHQEILDVDDARVPHLRHETVPAAEVSEAVTAALAEGFDVTTAVPIRVTSFEVTPTDHVLVLVAHHIAADGFSMEPLTRDIVIAYAARHSGVAPQWTPPAVQYADYAVWQRSLLGDETDPQSMAARQVAYWRDRLAGVPDEVGLPLDRQRPLVASGRGASVRFDVDAGVVQSAREVAREFGATEFMVMHAVLATLVGRLSGAADVVVGTPVAGRGERALDDVVGMFVNTLVLRTVIDPNRSFGELLGEAREADLGAFGNADIPFERLVEVLDPPRSRGRHPLFQVALAFQNLGGDTFEVPGLSVTAPEISEPAAKFDLQVTVADTAAGGWAIELIYATDLFDRATIESFGRRLELLLREVPGQAKTPVGDLNILLPGEARELTAAVGAGGWADETLLDLLAAPAADALALIDGDVEVTYGGLRESAHRIARYLWTVGVRPGDVVPIALPRSVRLAEAIWGVLAAGAAFVPIDPSYPADRIAHMVSDSGATVGITSLAHRDEVAAASGTAVRWTVLDDADVRDAIAALSGTAIDDAERGAGILSGRRAYMIYTSGSTGRPKGVAVSHRGVASLVADLRDRIAVDERSRVLSVSSPSFDASILELGMMLAGGAPLVISPARVYAGTELTDLIAASGVTHAFITPAVLASMDPAAVPDLRWLLAGGEAVPAEQVARWAPGRNLLNVYGPTETTAVSLASEPLASRPGAVPVGRPMRGVLAVVLDDRLQPVPFGIAGELYLSGPGVALGYHGQRALTAERFVANPFRDADGPLGGPRLYRTGDIVRWVANPNDGNDGVDRRVLDYLGRSDDQIKVRGLRIELGEISSVLAAADGVATAVTLVREIDSAGEQLVGYVVPEPGARPEPSRLIAEATEHLPGYMIPAAVVVVESIPVTANGKIDRAALPIPQLTARDFRAPVGPAEQIVAGIFAEVLGRERDGAPVGADDDFFDLGGNSLVATRLAARLGEAFGTTVPVRVIFEESTVTALAERVAPTAGSGRLELTARPRPERIPLSYAQNRMWFLGRFDATSGANNIPVAVRLTGAIDPAVFADAVADVVARQEILRTMYPEHDGVGYQLILPADDPRVPTLQIRASDPQRVRDDVVALMSEGFDVTTAVPVRVALLEAAADEYVLVVVAHHIAADGVSMGPLTRDLVAAYAARAAGRTDDRPAPAVQYADFALWQRDYLGDEADPESVIADQIAYWRRTLDDLPEQLDLPASKPRPAEFSGRGASKRLSLDETIRAGVEALARSRGVTPFMVVHTALAITLARLGSTRDVVIGSPIAGRGERALDELIGMFVNTLVLRTAVAPGDTVSEMLARVRDADLGAFGHADVPFERLVEILDPPRSPGRHPLFQVALSFQNMFGDVDIELPGLTVSAIEDPVAFARFDLQVTIGETAVNASARGSYVVDLTYAADIFDDVDIDAFARRFERVLRAVIADPSSTVAAIELLEPAELTALTTRRGDGWWDHETLPALLAAAVEIDPDAPAVVLGDRSAGSTPAQVSLTYDELDMWTSRIARMLIERGASTETFVAIGITRSIESVAAVWAVAKTGAAFVPVDPNYPADRIAHMLTDSGVRLGITTSRFVDALRPAADGVEWIVLDEPEVEDRLAALSDDPISYVDRLLPISSQAVAYVIYTSGSTGLPKGVEVTHSGLVSLAEEMRERFIVDERSRTMAFSSPSFDASMLELLLAVGSGAAMVIVPDTVYGGRELIEVLADGGVTHAFITPAALQSMDPGDLPRIESIMVGGEAYPIDVMVRWSRGRRYFNVYGPTEATILATSSRPLVEGDPMPIGEPLRGVTALVLDDGLRPAPVGVAGELYLAGPGVARGYHDRPGLSAERFVANPFPTGTTEGDRIYRTGDVVRWIVDADGSLQLDYVRRADTQVKVRGFRIELGEIDAELVRHPAVEFATTVVHRGADDTATLVSYVVPHAGTSVTADDLIEAVSERLAAHMVPSAIMVLDEMPLTANGKIDRRALPEPTFTTERFRAPETATEVTVAGVFAEVLDRERIGLDDDFFAIGGNSLIATRLSARLSDALGVRVGVRTVFENPTVEALAAHLAQAETGVAVPALVAGPRPAQIPLSSAQNRIWFLNRLDPTSAMENIPIGLRLIGDLDVDALRAALGDVVERQETLRTFYPQVDGVGHQVVLPVDDERVPHLVVEDHTGADPTARVVELVTTGFDVTTEVPARAHLLRVGDDEHLLVVVVNHIAGDGSSMVPLTRDVVVAYEARRRGTAPGWAPLSVQYADYTLWQHAVLGDDADPTSTAARQIGYWRERLAGIPDEVALPTDRPRPLVATGRGGAVRFDLDGDVVDRVHALARRLGVSEFMVVHAALAVLIGRLSNAADVVIGTPVAGRGERALDDLVGMFVNTLVLRTGIDPTAGFAEAVAAARDADLGAFANADVPFERLVEAIDPPRSQGRHPLFQVALFFQNLGVTDLELPGLRIEGLTADAEMARFDLQLTVVEQTLAGGDGWSVQWTYATDLYDEASVIGLQQRFAALLAAVTAQPDAAVGDIPLLLDGEWADSVSLWGGAPLVVPTAVTVAETGSLPFGGDAPAAGFRGAGDVLAGFRGWVERTPDAPALITDDGATLTYAQLGERVGRLARLLVSLGVEAEVPVVLGLRRGVDLVVGMYAVLEAGGVFVPIDPDHPADRVRFVLSVIGESATVLSSSDLGFAERFDIDPARVIAIDTPAATAAVPADRGLLTAAERTGAPAGSAGAYVLFTSGSTGKPKGVVVSREAIVNQMLWIADEFAFAPEDIYLQKTPVTFDVSMWGYLVPQATGGSVVLASPEGHRDPLYLAGLVDRFAVTLTDFVPSMLVVFAQTVKGPDARRLLGSLRDVLVIGEALSVEAVRAFAEVCAARVWNVYGPTEAAVSVTWAPADGSGSGAVSIGVGESGVRLYVLDSRLHPVPVGVAGELYLGGVQVARGYLGRPGLSSERFMADPFAAGADARAVSGIAGERMYRTGDVVVRSAAGLEYVGRSDFQVKLRGQRIELGEIESVLLGIDGVAAAVVTVVGSGGAERLIGYVVGESGSAPVESELVRTSGEALPGYMVPDRIVILDAFPLNVSGKVDRAALPVPDAVVREFRSAVTPVQEIVAGIFADVLGAERVGLDDEFFALGGNSLLGMRAVARLSESFGVRVPVRVLFENATVAGVADAVGGLAGGTGAAPLTAGERPDTIPLSYAQQRMWFLNRFDERSAAYNLPAAIRLTGNLDVAALRLAVNDVVARHEVLRTVYPEVEGTGVQVITSIDHARIDLDVDEIDEADLVSAVGAIATAPFDVTTDTPLRAKLFRVNGERGAGADEYILVFVVHHISADGSSLGPLTRDVMVAYESRRRGEDPAWQPLEVQYADYTLWQRAVLGSETDAASVISAQIDFWRGALAGVPDQLDLPTDHPRPAIQTLSGRSVEWSIDADLHARLVAAAQARGATLFMVIHSAFAALLARLSGSDDIAIGTPIAGRGNAALDDLIGMFVNTLVLRTRVDAAEPYAALLARTREADLSAFANADVPFERLVEVLAPERSTARHPIFQVGLSFQNLTATRLELPDLTVSAVEADLGTSQFDLHLIVGDTYAPDGSARGVSGVMTYATDLFDEATVRTMLERLTRVLEAVVADPTVPVGDIDILDADERRALETSNDTGHDLGADATATLAGLFERTVAAHPAQPALITDDTRIDTITFAKRVRRLARLLIDRGVGPDVPVAVAIERGIDLVTAMYAIVLAGGAYVPIEPSQPTDRVRAIVDGAQPQLLLVAAGGDTAERVGYPTDRVIAVDTVALDDWSDAPVTDADRIAPLDAQHLAYVIFTSGSTGVPKGVALPHAAVVNQMLWNRDYFGLDADDRVLLKTAATFDLSVWEFWALAVYGAALVIAAPGGQTDPAYLNEVMRREAVTTLHVVPSMLQALTIDGDLPTDLRHVLAIGEALPAATAQQYRAAGSGRLYNLYGPTEAAVSVTVHPVEDTDTSVVPIGVPEWNTAVRVLDARLRPVPVGVPGELYLAGVQLARGYHGRTDLTADRFVADPYAGRDDVTAAGTRMYRTGDVVIRTAGGALEYVGRSDFQVKVRGFRIELGDIETALTAGPDIASAAVLLHTDRAGERLVGYVVAHPGGSIDTAATLDGLRKALPSYMVPAVLVVLDTLPLNPNGKLDRAALPAPPIEKTQYRAPTTGKQIVVATAFAEVLGVGDDAAGDEADTRVGLDDDFFALGGDSIASIRLVARARALGLTLRPADVFERRTVEGIAAAATEGVAPSSDPQADITVEVGEAERERWTQRYPTLQHIWPPAPLQAGLVFHALMSDDGPDAYTMQAAVDLTGTVDVDRMHAAATALLDRHENLRAAFVLDDAGRSVQLIVRDVDLPWTYVDVRGESDPEAAATAATAADVARGFDLATPPLVRMSLIRLGEDRYQLGITVHHVVIDGWSMPILLRDLLVLYATRSNAAALPAPASYGSFLRWLDARDREGSLAAWQHALDGTTEPTLLARREAAGDAVVESRDVVLDAETTAALAALAAELGVTVNTIVQSAWGVLLGRTVGRTDVVFGSTVSGRPADLPDADSIAGLFINTIPVRVHPRSGATIAEVIRGVQADSTALLEHHHVGLPDIVRAAGAGAGFDTLLVYESYPIDASTIETAGADIDGMTVAGIDLRDGSHYPLTILIAPEERMRVRLKWQTTVIDSAEAVALGERLARVLRAFVADPGAAVDDIALVDAAEIAALSAAATHVPTAETTRTTIAAALAEMVEADPDAPAIVLGESDLTYADIDAGSSRLARALIDRGVEPGSRIAVAVDRSPRTVELLWALAKIGAAIVPLDGSAPSIAGPDHPVDLLIVDSARQAAIAADAGVARWADARLLLDDPELVAETAGRSAAPISYADRGSRLEPDEPFLITAAGRTFSRAEAMAVVDDLRERLAVDEQSRTFGAAGPVAAAFEMFTAAVSGAAVVRADEPIVDGIALVDVLVEEWVTHAFVPVDLLGDDPSEAEDLTAVVAVGSGPIPDRWSADRTVLRAATDGDWPAEQT